VPSFKVKFSGVTILQGVELSIFLLIFEWALQQCRATALLVILVVWLTIWDLPLQGSPFSVFLYDSVYLWAKTVDGVINMDKDPRDGALVLSLAKTHVFRGTRPPAMTYVDVFVPPSGGIKPFSTIFRKTVKIFTFRT